MTLQEFAAQEAIKNGLNPKLFLGQLSQESGWNTRATSSAGARGIGQLMPGTAKELGVKNVNDPYENIAASARYMGKLKNTFGNEDTARLAYNWGQGNVASYLRTGKGAKGQAVPKEAQEYNTRVYAKAGDTSPMASMAAYAPRRFPNEGSKISSIGNIGIENLESKLLSNPQAYAKKAYIEDMVASVPTKPPYMVDLENQLSAMFDATEILPKEYVTQSKT